MAGGRESHENAVYQVDAEDIAAFLKALRSHADKNRLGRLMRRGLAEKTGPFTDQMRDLIPAALPSGGGLGSTIQDESKFSVVGRTGRWAGLWVRATARSTATRKSRDLANMLGRGLIRHPVYGGDHPHNANRRIPWVLQSAGTNPALLRGAVIQATPDLRLAALEVMEAVAREIVKES